VDRALTRLETKLDDRQKARLKAIRPLAFDVGPDAQGFSAGAVYKMTSQGPQPVPVRVGTSDGSMAEVQGPLKAGEELIVGVMSVGGPKITMRVGGG
jgi:multidrug efflux pump subunit AcrA (membrane-fusion protein)